MSRLPPPTSAFAVEFPFEVRQAEAQTKLTERPDQVPIVLEAAKDSTLDLGKKRKFLVPSSMTMSMFIMMIRKRTPLSPDQAIFLFIDGKLAPTTQTMGQIYKEFHANDLFLYITVSPESTFG